MNIRLMRLLLSLGLYLVVGTRSQAVPVIFNATESAGPGEVVYLQGDNFTATPTVFFYLVGSTTFSGSTPPAGAIVLPSTSILTSSSQAMTIQLPRNIPMGLYALWVYDGSSYSAAQFINQARVTSLEYDQIAPYSAGNPWGGTFRIFGRNLLLNGLTPGSAAPQVNFVSGGTSIPATIVSGSVTPNDGNILTVQAPGGVQPNVSYAIQVSNGAGRGSGYDFTTSTDTMLGRAPGPDTFNLHVPWASDFSAIASDTITLEGTVNPHSATGTSTYGEGLTHGTSGSNWVNALQQALYDAGNVKYHPNGATVVLGAYTYNISYIGENATFVGPSVYNPANQTYSSNTLTIVQNAPNMTGHWELEVPARVVLLGQGIGQTIINDNSPAFNGYVFFLTFANVAPFWGHLSGATGFTYNPTQPVSAGYNPPAIRNFANYSSEMFFDHIAASWVNSYGTFTTSTGTVASCGDFCPQASVDSDILIQYCNMAYLNVGNANAYSNYYTYGSHYIVRDNTFASWAGRLEFVMMDHLLFDSNVASRDANFPTKATDATHGGGGLEASGSSNTIINNTFNAINVTPTNLVPSNNDGETILCQYTTPLAGGSCNPTESGTIPAASVTSEITSTSLTDTTTSPAKNWATNAYAGLKLTATWGPGNGLSLATTTIASNTSNVLTFASPLSRIPTGTYPVTYYIWQANPNVVDTGTVTSATSNTIVDTAKSWSLYSSGGGPYAGLILAITGGTAAGEWSTITGNTATKLILRGWYGGSTIPDSTSTFAIEQADSYVISTVTSSTATTLVDDSRDQPNQGWPINFHQGDTVAIVSGPGMGQIAQIISNTADTLTISPAWKEAPASGSQYSINGSLSNAAQHWLVKNNSLSQVPRGIIIGYGGYDNAIVGNTLDSAGGIFVGSTQRNTLSQAGVSVAYNRMDVGWKNLVTDNYIQDGYGELPPYCNFQGTSSTGLVAGPLLLGSEARRNILVASETLTPPWDGGFGCDQCLGNVLFQGSSGSGLLAGIGSLGTVFSDNLAIDNDIAYEVTSGDSQTVIADSMQQNCGNASGLNTSNNLLLRSGATLPSGDTDDILGDFLESGDGASNQTAVGTLGDGAFLVANFNGAASNTGLGGTGANVLDVGGTGTLVQALGESASIGSAATQFTSNGSGSGAYLHVSLLANGGSAGGGAKITSINPRYSWARIFDRRTGEFLVNGGFDFFLRPGENYPTTGGAQYMRAIDIGSPGSNSIRMVFYYGGTNQILLQVITPTNGGGNPNIVGAIPAGLSFTQGSIYHFGVTFSTDASKSPPLTTAKIYLASGDVPIDTTSSANLIGSGTFALNSSVVSDNSPSSWFNGGPWVFGGGYGPVGVPITNDFDGLRLYYIDPGLVGGNFPALENSP